MEKMEKMQLCLIIWEIFLFQSNLTIGLNISPLIFLSLLYNEGDFVEV